ncbi:hypothetical protein HNR39_003264 [Glaciimonas immobilis]|uniref:Uncharacterized protein n=1 Tax=Glaciimonas immobilis TaxID=728004 RepID=A0A840RY06_9BURK|nr:hypothetical protein [Glaciimonas immobilis]
MAVQLFNLLLKQGLGNLQNSFNFLDYHGRQDEPQHRYRKPVSMHGRTIYSCKYMYNNALIDRLVGRLIDALLTHLFMRSFMCMCVEHKKTRHRGRVFLVTKLAD